MLRWTRRRPILILAVGLSIGLLVGGGVMFGTLSYVNHSRTPELVLPETLLHATASHSGKSFGMATGLIDTDVEGLFTLDYLTGDLKCWVLNPRAPQMGWVGAFQRNVIADLGVQQGKEPNYVLVTGQVDFQRGAATVSPASCAVYVADANTGNFAAYTIMWDRTMARSGRLQAGEIAPLVSGKARTLEIRD
jgi:hypothetical protein